MLSRITYLLCATLILYASFIYYPRWKKPMTEAAIAWDVAGYYWYLPSVFIYQDLKEQGFRDSILARYYPTPDFQEGFREPRSGHFVMKYSSGMALLYLPFFTAAHLLARPLGYPPDGFSLPYQLAIQIGGVLVALLGLWLLRRFLKYYYEDKVVAIVLFLLVFGSNFLNWAAIDTGLSHTWLFALYALLLLQTRRFYLQPCASGAAGIGLLVGLAGLTRPTDLISCLIPLLWGLEGLSRASILGKLNFLREHWLKILLAAGMAAGVLMIQPLYWKYVTGHWIVYSYGDQGFSFLHPHFKDYTFDFSTGWLIYAPVMAFAIFGIFPFLRQGHNKVMVLSFVLLNYYLVASWDVWWYGSRAMIQSYPLLCILLAAAVTAILKQRWALMISSFLWLAAVYHNFWFTYFAHPGTLWPGAREQNLGLYDGSSMSRQYFWRVLGRWQAPGPEVWKLKDTKRIFEGSPKELSLLYQNDFESDTGFLGEAPIGGVHSLQTDAAHPESRHYTFALPAKARGWIRAEASFRCTLKEWDIWSMPQWHIGLIQGGQLSTDEALRVHRVLSDWETKTLRFDVKIPEQGADSAAIWLTGKSPKPLLMDDLKVWSFKE